MTDEHSDDCPHCGEDITSVIDGLKGVIAKTREEKKRYKENLREAKSDLADASKKLETAADPEAANKLQRELDELKANTVPKSDFDALTTELEESKATATQLQDEATQGKIATAVAKAGGNLAMLSPMIKAKLSENPDLDLGEHLATLKIDPDFGGAFKGSEHSGGGGPSGKTSSATLKAMQSANLRRGTMTDAQKNEYQKTHGLDALLDLPL